MFKCAYWIKYLIMNHIKKMLSVVDKIIKKSNYDFEYIDLGGGMGIDYEHNNKN